MIDWDKVFGNPKSSFIINAIVLNTKKVIYMNRQTGKEMHVNLVDLLEDYVITVVEIQYDDAYVLIDAIKIISLRIKKYISASNIFHLCFRLQYFIGIARLLLAAVDMNGMISVNASQYPGYSFKVK